MHFSLEINEQLASAMRAAAEFKVEVEKIIECVCENSSVSDEQNDYVQMSCDICDMIVRIGATMGVMLSEIALDEVRKLNPNNNLNPENHVSK